MIAEVPDLALETHYPNRRWTEAEAGNERSAVALSVLIPVFRFDAVPLVRAMATEPVAAQVALVVFDDGSGEPGLVRALAAAVLDWPGPAILVASARNRGRSAGRNALAEQARGDWWLFVDADMLPDAPDFLARWVAEAQVQAPEVVFGGFSLDQTSAAPIFALHRRQSGGAECLPAEIRNREPAKYVFTSNLLMHRTVFEAIAFDDGFTGWGWEDVDWGLRAAARFPVRHVDNPASHLGLASAADLVAKYRASGGNFARLAVRHPQAVANFPVMKAARALMRIPFRPALEAICAAIARDRPGIVPMTLRVLALKLMRACVYADALTPVAAAGGPLGLGDRHTVEGAGR